MKKKYIIILAAVMAAVVALGIIVFAMGAATGGEPLTDYLPDGDWTSMLWVRGVAEYSAPVSGHYDPEQMYALLSSIRVTPSGDSHSTGAQQDSYLILVRDPENPDTVYEVIILDSAEVSIELSGGTGDRQYFKTSDDVIDRMDQVMLGYGLDDSRIEAESGAKLIQALPEQPWEEVMWTLYDPEGGDSQGYLSAEDVIAFAKKVTLKEGSGEYQSGTGFITLFVINPELQPVQRTIVEIAEDGFVRARVQTGHGILSEEFYRVKPGDYETLLELIRR